MHRTNQFVSNLSNAKESFQRGVMPGAFLGAVLGLFPGILLILVLGGDEYGVSFSEVLSFIVMSVGAGALFGALVGGAIALAVVTSQKALKSLRLKS